MINHDNNMVWVNKYPLHADELNQIVSMMRANLKERLGHSIDDDKLIIHGAPISSSPYTIPVCEIPPVGVIWWEYSD